MDFFSTVKRAFGFADDGGDYEDDVRNTPYVNPFRKDGGQQETDELQLPTSLLLQEQAETAEILKELQEVKRQVGQMLSKMEAQREQAAKQSGSGKPDTAGKPHELKSKLAASESQRRAAQERAKNLAEELEQFKTRVATLENDKKGLLNRIRVMEIKAGKNAAAETSEAVAKMTAELNQAKQQNEKLGKQAEEARKQLEEKQKQAEETHKQLEERQKQLEQALSEQQQMSKSAEEKDQRIKQLTEELDEATENLKIAAEVQQKLEEVEQFKKRKNDEVTDLRQQLANQEQKLRDAMHAQGDSLEQSRREIEARDKTIERMQAMAKETADLHKRRDIDTANHIDAIKQQLASAVAAIEKNKHEREQLNEQLGLAATERDEARRAESEATARLAEANAQCLQQKEEIEALKQQLEAIARQAEADAASNQAENTPEQDAPAESETPSNETNQTEPSSAGGVTDLTSPGHDTDTAAQEPERQHAADEKDGDWLQPAEPSASIAAEPEPAAAPEQTADPKAMFDPRQLSLF